MGQLMVNSWLKAEGPPADSRWSHIVNERNLNVRVLGTLEGYVVCRHTGCVPFLVHLSEFNKDYQPAQTFARQR